MLIHGFPDSSSLWRHQVGALVDAGYLTITPDLRGFGDSPNRPAEVGAYGVRHSVADMLAVLDALEVERAHVVAHDWGAAVGWALAGFAGERWGASRSCRSAALQCAAAPDDRAARAQLVSAAVPVRGHRRQLLMHDDRLFREWTRGDGDARTRSPTSRGLARPQR